MIAQSHTDLCKWNAYNLHVCRRLHNIIWRRSSTVQSMFVLLTEENNGCSEEERVFGVDWRRDRLVTLCCLSQYTWNTALTDVTSFHYLGKLSTPAHLAVALRFRRPSYPAKNYLATDLKQRWVSVGDGGCRLNNYTFKESPGLVWTWPESGVLKRGNIYMQDSLLTVRTVKRNMRHQNQQFRHAIATWVLINTLAEPHGDHLHIVPH